MSDDKGTEASLLPYISAAVFGFITCMAITLATGKGEAWDTGAYYSVGIPIMMVLIFAISYLYPDRPWRWTFAMAAGQVVAAILQGSSPTLFPIAAVFLTLISIPQFIAGNLGARWSRSREARETQSK